MLGKKMGYEIQTCRMQYDAVDMEQMGKQTRKINADYTLEGSVL